MTALNTTSVVGVVLLNLGAFVSPVVVLVGVAMLMPLLVKAFRTLNEGE